MTIKAIRVSLSGARFDEILHGLGSVRECGDLEIAVKPKATNGQRAGVVVTFSVVIAGRIDRVQAVTTLRNLRGAVLAMASIDPPAAEETVVGQLMRLAKLGVVTMRTEKMGLQVDLQLSNGSTLRAWIDAPVWELDLRALFVLGGLFQQASDFLAGSR